MVFFFYYLELRAACSKPQMDQVTSRQNLVKLYDILKSDPHGIEPTMNMSIFDNQTRPAEPPRSSEIMYESGH